MFSKLTVILEKVNTGTKMEEATSGLTFAEKWMFRDYLDSVVL
jgi:hypothetical protein